jgi:hypothetical protein
LLAAFSPHQETGIRSLQFKVVEAETNQFRNTQSRGEAEIEHGLVPNSVVRSGIRGIEDRLHFLPGQMVD